MWPWFYLCVGAGFVAGGISAGGGWGLSGTIAPFVIAFFWSVTVFVPFHPARYASSRPWAKRVAHLFEQGGAPTCDALVLRALQATPGGVGQDAARQEIECLLAKAYGSFVSHGRQVLLADDGLAMALAVTHPPKVLPEMSGVPAAFFVALPDAAGAGAFVCVDDVAQQLRVVMLAAGFAATGTAWWQRADEVLALTLRYGESLVLPDVPEVLPWRDALHALFNSLAMLVQPRCQQVAEPAQGDKARAEALRRGELPVRRLVWPELACVAGVVAREGYWRRQAGVDAVRLVWVPPR